MGLGAAELRQISYECISHLSSSGVSKDLVLVLVKWASEILSVSRLDDYGPGLGQDLVDLIKYAVWYSSGLDD